MDYVFWACAIIGCTLIVCQFLMTLLGLGGHHDFGDGHDFGGTDMGGHDAGGTGEVHSHEVGHGQEPSIFFTYLTFRTLTAAVAFFGLAGLATRGQGMEDWQVIAIALGAGAVALVLVGKLMGMLGKLNVDGTVRIEHSVGCRGTVYLSIPGKRGGAGKVHISQSHRLMEYKAVTTEETLATGAKIVVVGVIAPDTVEVSAATTSERLANA